MKGKFCKRVLSVLLCISMFFSFSAVAFAEAAIVGGVMNVLFGILEGLISDGIVEAFSKSDDGYYLDKDNYEKFAAALGSTPFPKCGQMVSTATSTNHLVKLYCPDYGYSDWYCQPYIISGGNMFIISAYLHYFYSDNKLCSELYKYTNSYSSADLFSSGSHGDYKFVLLEGSLSNSEFQFRLRFANDISSFNAYNSFIISYTNGLFKQSDCFGSSVFDKNDITDYGYYMSRTPFSASSLPPDTIPEGGSVFVPRNASSLSDLRVATGSPDVGSGGNGSTSGNLTVGGRVEVEGKVDINIIVPDINININGNGENPNDYIDPGEIETDLDNYLQYVPKVSKDFIDYLKDFFSWLPPPVYGILMLGLVVAVFCRLSGR